MGIDGDPLTKFRNDRGANGGGRIGEREAEENRVNGGTW